MGKSYLFINNPISGGGKHKFIEIFEPLKHKFPNHRVISTTHKGHATDIASQNINNFDIIVAVGGDGTVHEIASALVNTSIPMGIIPQGSGNGFSNHLGISSNTTKALHQLKSGTTKPVDTVQLNQKIFVNIAGVGFDGHIAALFDKTKLRGFWSYARLVITEFLKYKEFDFSLTSGIEKIKGKAFIIAFANSSQYGNNFQIAPNAITDDGLLNVMIFKKPSILAVPLIVWKMFNGKKISSKYCKELIGNNFIIMHERSSVQLDGEPVVLGSDAIHVRVKPRNLKIIC